MPRLPSDGVTPIRAISLPGQAMASVRVAFCSALRAAALSSRDTADKFGMECDSGERIEPGKLVARR